MKKILLIEDDKIMRENSAEILELAGYQIVVSENGKKGAQLAKETKPDLIICDIMMPELDGYGVLHVLSKDPSTATIPFIFLTAKAEKSEMRKGMSLGADDYLTKPFEETDLLNAVESRLKKNELIKKEFTKNMEGVNQFLDEVSGLKELKTLSCKRPVVFYKKKEVFFHEEDLPQHLFFINKGKVKTYKVHDDGKEYITGLYHSGEFFGYFPLLENSNYSDSALALEECEILKIPKVDFLSLVYKNRDVAGKFIKMLCNHIGEKEEQLLKLAYDTVRKRVADAILRLIKLFPKIPGKAPKITMSREDLAGMAGTASETVIRTLSEFKEEELIDLQGREILVLDVEGLQEIQ